MTDRNTNRGTATPGAFDTIAWGGLLAGTLDAVDGVVAFGFKVYSIEVVGIPPVPGDFAGPDPRSIR